MTISRRTFRYSATDTGTKTLKMTDILASLRYANSGDRANKPYLEILTEMARTSLGCFTMAFGPSTRIIIHIRVRHIGHSDCQETKEYQEISTEMVRMKLVCFEMAIGTLISITMDTMEKLGSRNLVCRAIRPSLEISTEMVRMKLASFEMAIGTLISITMDTMENQGLSNSV